MMKLSRSFEQIRLSDRPSPRPCPWRRQRGRSAPTVRRLASQRHFLQLFQLPPAAARSAAYAVARASKMGVVSHGLARSHAKVKEVLIGNSAIADAMSGVFARKKGAFTSNLRPPLLSTRAVGLTEFLNPIPPRVVGAGALPASHARDIQDRHS